MITDSTDAELDALRMRTVIWVIGLATMGLVFNGYDLVVYSAVVSNFLSDASHIGTVTPVIPGMPRPVSRPCSMEATSSQPSFWDS